MHSSTSSIQIFCHFGLYRYDVFRKAKTINNMMDNANARRVARLTQHATPFPSAFTMRSAIL